MTESKKHQLYFGRETEKEYIRHCITDPEANRYLIYLCGAGGVGKTAFMDLISNLYGDNPATLVLDTVDFDDLTLRMPTNFMERMVSQLTAREKKTRISFRKFLNLWTQSIGESLSQREEQLPEIRTAFVNGMNNLAKRRRLVFLIDTLEKAPLWFPGFFAQTIASIQNLVVVVAGRPQSQGIEHQLEEAVKTANGTLPAFTIHPFETWGGLDLDHCHEYFAQVDLSGAAGDLAMVGIKLDNKFKKKIWKLANGIPFQVNLAISLIHYLEMQDSVLNRAIHALMTKIQNASLDEMNDQRLRDEFQRALVMPFVVNYKHSRAPGETIDCTSRIIMLLAHTNHFASHVIGGFDSTLLAELDDALTEKDIECGLEEIRSQREKLYTFVKLYRGPDGRISGVGLHDEMVRMLNKFAWMQLEPPGLTDPPRKNISMKLVAHYDRRCAALSGQENGSPTDGDWMHAVDTPEGQALLLARTFHALYLDVRQGWDWIYNLSERIFKQSYFDTLLFDSVEAYVRGEDIGDEADVQARMDVWKAASLIARREEKGALEDAANLLHKSIDAWSAQYSEQEATINKMEQAIKVMQEQRRALLAKQAQGVPIEAAIQHFNQLIADDKTAIQNMSQLSDLERAYTALGYVYRLESRWDDAIKYYNTALRYSRWLGNRDNIAEISNNIANVYLLSGQLYRAALYSQISTIIRKRLEIQDKLGNSYRILGMINWRIGNTYECRGYWHLARQCYASRPSDLAIIDQYDGYIYYRIGDTDRGYRVRKQIPGFGEKVPDVQSFPLLEKAIQNLERSDRQDELASTYNILSRAYRRDNDFDKAERSAEKALLLSRNMPYRKAEAYLSMAMLYYRWGRRDWHKGDETQALQKFEKVRDYFREGFPIAQERQLIDLISVFNGVMGNVEYALGEAYPEENGHYEAAFRYYVQECLAAARTKELRFERALNEIVADRLARTPLNLAMQFANMLTDESAWINAGLERQYHTLVHEVDGIKQFLGVPASDEIKAMDQRFNQYMRTGEYKKALAEANGALSQFYRIRWSIDTVRVLLKTAQAYRKLAQYTEARRYCKQALVIVEGMLGVFEVNGTEAEMIELIKLKAHSDFTMGRILWEIGNTAEAATHFTDALEMYIKHREDPEMYEGLVRSVQYEGFMRFRIREFDQALTFLEWAEAEYRKMNNQRRVLKVLIIKARVLRDRNNEGDIAAARLALDEAQQIIQAMPNSPHGVDKYAEAECYLTLMILEYQEHSAAQDPAERLAHLDAAEKWYTKGMEIALQNQYILLLAVFEGVEGNILFDRLTLLARGRKKPDLEPAFTHYLEECRWDTYYEKRRFFRSLDLLMRRLSVMSSDEVLHYVDFLRARWIELDHQQKLPRLASNGPADSSAQAGAHSEYLVDMDYFCNLMEEFSEYIARP